MCEVWTAPWIGGLVTPVLDLDNERTDVWCVLLCLLGFGMRPTTVHLNCRMFSYQKRSDKKRGIHTRRETDRPGAGERQFLIYFSLCSSHTSSPSYPRSGVFSFLCVSSITVWMSVPVKIFCCNFISSHAPALKYVYGFVRKEQKRNLGSGCEMFEWKVRFNVCVTVTEHTACLACKTPNNPYTCLDRPWGFQEVEASRFRGSLHMKLVTSALHTGRLYPYRYSLLLEAESTPGS